MGIRDLYRHLLDRAEARMSPEGEARMSLAEVLAKPAPEPEDTPKPDRIRGVAHLMDGVLSNLNHSARHLDTLKTIPAGDANRLEYNLDHLENHLAESIDHAIRLGAALAAYFPAVGAELGQLHQVTRPDARSAEYERGFAEVRERWSPGPQHEADDWSRTAAYDSARGRGSN